MKYPLLLFLFFNSIVYCVAQPVKNQGSLFIIGGGDRTPGLMQSLAATAGLQPTDYIIVLPMSGENPDTSFYYITEDLRQVFTNPILKFNFTKEKVNDKAWLDSLQKAKLVFITGGDQSRFMNIVLHTPVHDAIKKCFARGGTIAGTSAGAAMMSKKMITGNQLIGDSIGEGPFTTIRYKMVEVKEGLGLLNTAVIDQHFIARSRYNRLLSVLAANPQLDCIGIDEETAIIVKEKTVTVTGDNQVIRLRLPAIKNAAEKNNHQVQMKNVQLDVLTAGDIFMLK